MASKGEEEEKQYVVYCNINSSEEDYSFLITALYHWESLYPTFTLEQPTNPKDIVVKAPPPPKKEPEDGKKEDASENLADSQIAKLLQSQESEVANVDF